MVPVIVSNTASIYYSGIGSTSIDKIFPEKKDGINAATSVATGPYHTCTIESGIVYCWGFNSDGQLGNGGTTNTQTPSTVVTIGSATQIAVGSAHSCAILADKTVRCW